MGDTVALSIPTATALSGAYCAPPITSATFGVPLGERETAGHGLGVRAVSLLFFVARPRVVAGGHAVATDLIELALADIGAHFARYRLGRPRRSGCSRPHCAATARCLRWWC